MRQYSYLMAYSWLQELFYFLKWLIRTRYWTPTSLNISKTHFLPVRNEQKAERPSPISAPVIVAVFISFGLCCEELLSSSPHFVPKPYKLLQWAHNFFPAVAASDEVFTMTDLNTRRREQ